MASVIQHLETISDRYTVFEDDQVLTKEPLNALVDYLDDQERLTRVALLGVGIFCGLRTAIDGSSIVLTKGVGVTTDGDLLRVPRDQTFTRFRDYDQNAPKYDPFFQGAAMRKVVELLGDDVATAAKLDTFTATTGKNTADLVAVLLMESALRDGDVCTGGDCDNKGQQAQGNVRLLLLDRADVAALQEKTTTLDASARDLRPIHAERVPLGPSLDTVAKLTQAIRKAATATRDTVKPTLARAIKACKPILGDLFPTDPSPGWSTRLDAAVPDAGIQLYHDFLKDLVDTCNALGATLAGDTSVCCPALETFPKHLMLGIVGTGETQNDPNRTGFYPSPLVGATRQTFDRARYLVRRIDTLVNSFTPAIDTAATVAITPSRTDERPLDDRAIPAYYNVDLNAAWPIHRAWSFELERRGLPVHNYSANAAAYKATGPAAAPLTASIAAYPVLRVERHLGRKVDVVTKEIEDAIAKFNLPFTVRAVLLGADRPKIVVKPPIRYNDLHRLHHLIRYDVNLQLDDMIAQSDRFRTDVTQAVTDKVFENRTLGTGLSITGVADETFKKVDKSAKAATAKLAQSYTQYKASAWQDDVKEAMLQAADMRVTLGDVARTDFVSPVDSMVANKHTLWAEWLDRIIDAKDEQEDDRLLFTNFVAQHPAAEHAGAVPRGGTFVLVYDGNGLVVGDVTLPYYWPEVAQPEPEQKPLPPPKSRPPLVVDKGWRVFKPIDLLLKENIATKLDDFKKIEFDPLKQQTLEFSKSYVQAVKDSTQIFTGIGQVTLPGTKERLPTIGDQRLDAAVKDLITKTGRVDTIRKVLVDPVLEQPKRTEAEGQLATADKELAQAIEETAKIITGGNVDARTDGAAAAGVVSDALAKLSASFARSTVVALRKQMDAAGVKADVKAMMGGVVTGRALL